MSISEFTLRFDPATIKHLGLQMYSTLPPVIAEVIANAWDANATLVDVTVPTERLTDESTIVIQDDGDGMTAEEIENLYLVVGRDRREDGGEFSKPEDGRRVMGRKGIGKFSAFGVARMIEVESAKGGEVSRFILDYESLLAWAKIPENLGKPFKVDRLPGTGAVTKGTQVTLRNITKYRTRSISITDLRRKIARRFSVLSDDFEVQVNADAIGVEERDLKRHLDHDVEGRPYLWEVDEETVEGSGWRVHGWIGALDRTAPSLEGVESGITIMARGKLVQEPFVFEATVGQQFALSYMVGELHADFVDAAQDTISTSRNSLVWDAEPNRALKDWGQRKVNRIAREWGEKRSADNERRLETDPIYQEFRERAERLDHRAGKVVDRLIRKVVADNILGEERDKRAAIQLCLDFMEFDSFVELADELREVEDLDTARLINLFREWEVLEAREMMRVTKGRIETIRRLQHLVDTNALEVPILHQFLREFPWVLDPRWTLIADEVRYSKILRDRFGDDDRPEPDRRIDFLCVREATQLVVVEIKRPHVKATTRELRQIEEYVHFMRAQVQQTSDPDVGVDDVVGYLLVGDVAPDPLVREKQRSLSQTRIYVRRYGDLLDMVVNDHREFLERYERLRARSEALPASVPSRA